MAERTLCALQRLLRCPVCKGKIEFSPGFIRCRSCSLQFLQSKDDYFDLLPHHLLENIGKPWRERQQEMEEWYKDLIANPAAAKDCFVNDYAPYAPLLATLSGDVLDVGGGVGIVRDYLPRDVQYIVVDPSLDWLGDEWAPLAKDFPSLETKPHFVRGVGEYLPFPDEAFDAVLTLWTLNHVADPGLVFSEVYRVLRSGGRFLIILEDMPPSWGDIANGTFPASMVAAGGGDPSMENPAYTNGQEWPVHSDHLRIRESDIQRWSSHRFELIRREWVDHNQYLAFEFSKVDSLQRVQKDTKDAEIQQSQYRIRMLQDERRDFVQRLQALEQQLYSYTLVNEVRAHVRRREWMQALRGLLALLLFHPRAFVHAWQKLKLAMRFRRLPPPPGSPKRTNRQK